MSGAGDAPRDVTLLKTRLGDPVSCIELALPYVVVGLTSGELIVFNVCPSQTTFQDSTTSETSAGGEGAGDSDMRGAAAFSGDDTPAATDASDCAAAAGADAGTNGETRDVAADATSVAPTESDVAPTAVTAAATSAAPAGDSAGSDDGSLATPGPSGDGDALLKPSDVSVTVHAMDAVDAADSDAGLGAAAAAGPGGRADDGVAPGGDSGGGGDGSLAGGESKRLDADREAGLVPQVWSVPSLDETVRMDLKPFSDEAIKGAHVDGRRLFVAVGDVWAEQWDLKEGERVHRTHVVRRHTYRTCPASYVFQNGTTMTVLLAEGDQHVAVDMVAGRQRKLAVALPRKQLPRWMDGEYLVTKDHGAGATKRVHIWQWGEREARKHIGGFDVNDTWAETWGFFVRHDWLFVCQGSTVTVRDATSQEASVLHTCKCGSRDVVAASAWRRDAHKFVAVTEDATLTFWDEGRRVGDAQHLPAIREFVTQVPYFVCVADGSSVKGGGGLVVYNDDTGVHVRFGPGTVP